MVLPRPAARITHAAKLEFSSNLRSRKPGAGHPDSEGAMRKARFTEEQMVAIIREAECETVPAVAKRHGISEQTIYSWRKRFGNLQANDMRRLRQLESENARLKKLVAERDLEIEVMKEVWRAAGLQVPRKRPRKRVAAARPRPQAPCGPNQVWSYDFVFDHCANGQQLKWLTVTDEFTKGGLAIEVDGRIRSPRVIEVLSRLVSARGAPTFLRSDNGPEFVSKALLSWIVAQGIGTALIEPGKPWQNGVAESFIGKFRDECLSLEWFRSRAEAKVIIEAWRRHYSNDGSENLAHR
jgi:putative transposase